MSMIWILMTWMITMAIDHCDWITQRQFTTYKQPVSRDSLLTG